MDLVRHFEEKQTQDTERPHLKPGDVVRVEMKVTESGKTRVQAFEGSVLGVRGSGPSATFTVRRETGGFGVERIFPLYSPLIEKIEIIRRQKVRRSKLHYLRQAGRRRFKEDVKSMQDHVKAEDEKKRLASAAAKALADKEVAEKRKAVQAAKKEEAVAKAAEDKAEETKTEDKPAEGKPEEK